MVIVKTSQIRQLCSIRLNLHVLFTLFACACVQWCPTNTVLCFLFCCSSSSGPYVASFSRWFILDFPFGILQRIFIYIHINSNTQCAYLILFISLNLLFHNYMYKAQINNQFLATVYSLVFNHSLTFSQFNLQSLTSVQPLVFKHSLTFVFNHSLTFSL